MCPTHLHRKGNLEYTLEDYSIIRMNHFSKIVHIEFYTQFIYKKNCYIMV